MLLATSFLDLGVVELLDDLLTDLAALETAKELEE